MRPKLHPDMGQTVLCARVARQLTALHYSRATACPFIASVYAREAARDLPPDYPGFLRFALHSLAVYVDIGFTSSEWLSCVLEAAHFGHSFRRCFFFDYKATRCPYPRVTNRGVQNSRKPAGSRKRKAKGNA